MSGCDRCSGTRWTKKKNNIRKPASLISRSRRRILLILRAATPSVKWPSLCVTFIYTYIYIMQSYKWPGMFSVFPSVFYSRSLCNENFSFLAKRLCAYNAHYLGRAVVTNLWFNIFSKKKKKTLFLAIDFKDSHEEFTVYKIRFFFFSQVGDRHQPSINYCCWNRSVNF